IERSFSADPATVREMASLCDRVAREAGIGLCLKHFPGLGSATTNSHLDLTDVTETLTDAETELFYELGEKTAGKTILLSHAWNRRWDAENPASLSAEAVMRLRQRAPNALLVTDDVQMQGLQKICPTSEVGERALRAGVDWILIGNNLMREE